MELSAAMELSAPEVQKLFARDADVDAVLATYGEPPQCTGGAPCCMVRTCVSAPRLGCKYAVLGNLIDTFLYRAGMYPGGSLKRYPESRMDAAEFPDIGLKVQDAQQLYSYKNGGDEHMDIRVVSPLKTTKKLPIVVFFHGGGFAVGSALSQLYFRHFRLLAEAWGMEAHVVSPEYRLAPEYPFPHAVYDSYDVFQWLASPESHGVLPPDVADRENIVVAGDSAGGNLTLVLGSLLKDNLRADLAPASPEMQSLKIKALGLFYPAVMLAKPVKSMLENTNGVILKPWQMKWFDMAYLGNGDTKDLKRTDRRVCALNNSLDGLPPVVIASAGKDPLRDESFVLEQCLKSAGIDVVHFTAKSSPHGFLGFGWDKDGKETRDKAFAELVARSRA
mmetsp:Transcript_15510/g.49475  ORF Transcript_15510/g.49475 Transcript_15510/m.49475 type:complete len:391 (-) Transcript_15510:307-1479(-)